MSALAAALEARVQRRPSLTVPLSEVVRDGSVEGTVAMRALTVQEECEATEDAIAFRKRTLASLPEKHAQAFLDDPSFLEDAKHIERLWRACRQSDDLSQPAFKSSDWMRRHFTVDECRRLAEWFGRAERLNSKEPEMFTREQRTSLMEGLAMVAHTSMPDRALDGLPRWVLADLLIDASAQWKAERDRKAA
jgi:hypothetical protein